MRAGQFVRGRPSCGRGDPSLGVAIHDDVGLQRSEVRGSRGTQDRRPADRGGRAGFATTVRVVDALRRGTTRVCLGRSEDGGGGGDGSQTESGAGAAAAAGVAGEAQARRRRSSGCSRGGSSLDESGRRGAVSPSRSRERTRCRNQPPSPSAPTSSHPNRKVSLSLPKLYQNPGARLWQCIWLVGTPLIDIKASPSPGSQRAERAAGEKTRRGSADNCRGRRKNSDSSAAHISAPIG